MSDVLVELQAFEARLQFTDPYVEKYVQLDAYSKEDAKQHIKDMYAHYPTHKRPTIMSIYNE